MAIAPTAGHALGGSRFNENFIQHDTGLFQINSGEKLVIYFASFIVYLGVMVMNFTRILNADWSLSYDEQARQKPGKPLKYGSELLLKYYR